MSRLTLIGYGRNVGRAAELAQESFDAHQQEQASLTETGRAYFCVKNVVPFTVACIIRAKPTPP